MHRRFEFIEAIVRLLGAAYGLEKKDRPAGDDGAAAAERAAEDFSTRLAALPADARDDPDDYRRERLYTEACCDAFSRHKRFWQEIHRIMSAIAMDAGRPAFNMDRWLEFTELTGMRTSETTLTEAVKAYVVSRTRFLDDTVFKFELLDFVSFLEAIARLVEMTPVPSKAALTELGVDQVSEFYERVAALKEAVDGDEDRRRLSRLLAEDADQALSEKLELMLPYMLQNLTISTNGAYRTKNTHAGCAEIKSEFECPPHAIDADHCLISTQLTTGQLSLRRPAGAVDAANPHRAADLRGAGAEDRRVGPRAPRHAEGGGAARVVVMWLIWSSFCYAWGGTPD